MGTHHKGTRAEVRALDAYIKLMRAADSLSARLSETISAAGLSESQFGVLEALYHLGPLCQREIAAKLLRSSGNITLVIDNLEAHGLVRRERQQHDRRYITVSLTDAGRKLIAEIFPSHVARIVEELGILTASEQEELGRLCKKLGLQITE
jgi:MarR family 2-MHQ and catechol resistance regulon transcriptional repressor